ncbi:MAG: cell surface protein SprA, partial [Fulvivirga sp.]|nr:cell surface protein SprA [Fulvivirga sp.]
TLDASLLTRPENERDEYEDIVTDETTRKSINFTNVRKEKTKPDAKQHIYDIENFSFTYAYSEVLQTNFNLQKYLRRNYNAAIAYNYSPTNEPWEPFKNSKAFKSPWFKLIKDFNFNPVPTNVSVRADLNRQLITTIYRNDEGAGATTQSNFEKLFTFNRNYNLRWDFTKNLSAEYSARVNAVVDEPNANPNGGFNQKREFVTKDQYNDSIWTNLKNLGRMKNFDQRINANYRLPLDKIPITDWLNSEYRYQASYAWKAGPLYTDSAQRATRDFGNTIQNSRDNTISGKIDMVTLYNKIGFLKKINSPSGNRRVSSLRQSNQADTTKTKAENKGLKGMLRFLMSLRAINGTFTLREGTFLPGYQPRAFLFGMDSSFNAPGIPFILGSQDPDIRFELARQGYLIRNQELTAPFAQTKTMDYNIRADLEPFKDFQAQITLNKTKSAAFEEIFRFDSDANGFVSLSPTRSGGYSVSFLPISTTFIKSNENNKSPVFEDFEDYRVAIHDRFEAETGIDYDTNAQDVLIPAFIAAYTGKSPEEISLSPFPRTPMPNWRIDYTGLGRVKKLKEIFQSISISHGYNSNYSVLNYTNANEFNENIGLENSIEDYNVERFGVLEGNAQNVPTYVISQVMITEQFAPLIGVSVRTKDRFSVKAEYKKQRDLALNISNAQITEVKSNDIVFEVNYTKANFKLPFKSQGRVITLKNDLTFRMNFTIRDTETIQRKIDEDDKVTNGNLNIQIRPNVQYVVNEKLNVQFYFERNINEPSISISPRRATTRAGFQVRFSLAQ